MYESFPLFIVRLIDPITTHTLYGVLGVKSKALWLYLCLGTFDLQTPPSCMLDQLLDRFDPSFMITMHQLRHDQSPI